MFKYLDKNMKICYKGETEAIMIIEQNILQDLEDICAQTKARYLMYDAIHTENYEQDSELFVRAMLRIGMHYDELFEKEFIVPEYGGGFCIKHKDEISSGGYTQEGNKRCLMVLPGYVEDREKQTIYHEAAHVYQYKYNILDVTKDDDYTIYQTEVHANVFSAMVSLLKAKNVLEYKKEQLSRFAEGIANVNEKDETFYYYTSLPVELELMKEIRRKGRQKTLDEFSKHGILDYKKIAFYTAQLVKRYCYSKEEFEKIKKEEFVPTYERLKRKARAYRLLGKVYLFKKNKYYEKKINRHYKIDLKRIEKLKEKMNPLPENSEENKAINALCKIDNIQITLVQGMGVFPDLEMVVADEEEIPERLKQEEKEKVKDAFEKIKEIYQEWKDNAFFQTYFKKINNLGQRDELWALKEQKKKEIVRKNFALGLTNER